MKKRDNVIWITVLVLAVSLLNKGLSAAGKSNVTELAKLSIEELISIKVTSVLKTSQPMAESPAAVYVVTRQDILRSGADSIPDLLRMVPGVQVAEVEEEIYAVSIRGFNDIHANKLLVMVDGRSVYNHIFSGVIWPMMDLIMEDIDRIEVIRGPGASTWGANAVNGVINIITRKTEETKGTLIQFGAGKPDAASGSVRYGGDLGENGAFRIYAKGVNRKNDHYSQQGFDTHTKIDSEMGGFRADWRFGDSDNLTFQGEIMNYGSESIERMPASEAERSVDQKAWHLLSQWRHSFSEQSETTFKLYYQQDKREDDFQFDTIDLDFQHNYTFSPRHQLAWGFGYRFISDELMQGLYGSYTYDPVKRDLDLFSFFIQDTIQLIPDDLNLTIGSKFEHNDYTGFEIQPGIRLGWTPHKRHFLWGSVSRAVLTPSRLDSDSSAFFGGQETPGNIQRPLTEIRGSEDFDSEELFAYEIGYRIRPLDELWFDIAGFYNVYDKLTAYVEKERNVWGIANDMDGDTYGFEVSAEWRPAEWWKLTGSWSFLKMDMQLKNSRAADLTGYTEDTSPQHQFTVHSSLNLSRQVTFDLWVRHADGVRHMLPYNGFPGRIETIDAYTAFDARLAWKPVKELELSVTGRNLGGAHQEFTHYEVEESLFFNVKIEL